MKKLLAIFLLLSAPLYAVLPERDRFLMPDYVPAEILPGLNKVSSDWNLAVGIANGSVEPEMYLQISAGSLTDPMMPLVCVYGTPDTELGCPIPVAPAITGTVLSTCASGCDSTSFATNITNVACGGAITLKAGESFTGNFTWNKQCTGPSGNGWITVKADTCPAAATQRIDLVSPSSANMPTLITNVNNTAAFTVATNNAGTYLWLDCVHVTISGAITSMQTGLVLLGSGGEASASNIPAYIICSRCFIEGTAAMTAGPRSGVRINCNYCGVIYSYIREIHEVGADAQGIIGYAGNGPCHIEENKIEASTENIMFGGAKGTTATLMSDCTVRRNYLTKLVGWETTYSGREKNHFEIKGGRRILFEQNVNYRNRNAGQNGDSIVLTPRVASAQGWAGLTTVSDITLRWNFIYEVGKCMNVSGYDDTQTGEARKSLQTSRIAFVNNLCTYVDQVACGAGNPCYGLQFLNGVTYPTVNHNTILTSSVNGSVGVYSDNDTNSAVLNGREHTPLIYTNNINDASRYPFRAQTCSPNGVPSTTLTCDYPTYTWSKNVWVDLSTTTAGIVAGDFPAGTCGTGGQSCYPTTYDNSGSPGLNMADPATCRSAIATVASCALAAGSVYKLAGTDGKDIGVDAATLATKISGVQQ